MPNVDNPHGLYPVMRTMAGGNVSTAQFKKAATYGTALFIFDAVNRVADGSIEASATPGTTLYSGVNLNWGAASKLTTHLVIQSPDALFEAQDDGGGFAEIDMGLNANLLLNAGNALTNLSKHEVNGVTKDVTATLDVHVIQKLEHPENAYGANVRVELIFNKHRMHPGVVGV